MAQARDIMAELTPVFRDVFMDDGLQIRPEMKAGDVLGWDSLTNISLMFAVQAHFGIKLSTRDIESLANIGDLVACVAAKLAA